jgi:predicted nuclease of predicted toxin-antitoxin system
MKLLIDMNLSPDWVAFFTEYGWEAVHWSTVGDPRPPDTDLMSWAIANDCVVFTHNLDFGTLLVVTRAQSPSVIQILTQDVMPATLGSSIVRVLQEHEAAIREGVLITVDETRSRVRILPF